MAEKKQPQKHHAESKSEAPLIRLAATKKEKAVQRAINSMTGMSEDDNKALMDAWLEDSTPSNSGESQEEIAQQVAEARQQAEEAVAEHNAKIEHLKSTLNEGQAKAIEQILSKPTGMVLVEGHAGTGKSYVLKVMLEILWNHKSKVCLAPTHQALDQITDLYHDKNVFMTLASFFGVSSKMDSASGQDLFTDPELKDGDMHDYYLFGDEVSMYGANEIRLLEKLAETNRVVLFGDFAQLPPVKKERLDLPNYVKEKVVLTEQMRNGDMVLFLCNHFRSKTSVPRSSRGNVVVHDDRRTMLNIFLDEIKKHPVPGDISYIAYTNKQMRQVRSEIKEEIYNGEDYPVGQWLRLESSEEGIRQGGKIVLTRRNIIGQVAHAEPTTVDLMGRTLDAYLLELTDKEGRPIEHGSARSEIGKSIIPSNPRQFLTLSFDGLDALEEMTRKQFNENRKLYRMKGKDRAAEIDHKQGVRWVQESQRLTKALSPYALTAHKSQGMSINTVFLDADNILRYSSLPNHPTKELLYVGASRTRKILHVYS